MNLSKYYQNQDPIVTNQVVNNTNAQNPYQNAAVLPGVNPNKTTEKPPPTQYSTPSNNQSKSPSPVTSETTKIMEEFKKNPYVYGGIIIGVLFILNKN